MRLTFEVPRGLMLWPSRRVNFCKVDSVAGLEEQPVGSLHEVVLLSLVGELVWHGSASKSVKT